MVENDDVRKRAVPSQLLQEARLTAWRMVEDDGVKRRTVPSQLPATLATALRMAEDDGVKRRAAPRVLLTEARHIA